MSQLPETIVLCGPAGSGKNAVADALSREHGYVQVALADPIKRFCAARFGTPTDLMWGASELRSTKIPRVLQTAQHRDLSMNGRWRLVSDALLLPKGVKDVGYYEPDRQDDRLASLLESEIVDTPRRLLQLVGTEWGRAYDPLLWCRHALLAINAIRAGIPYDARAGLWTAASPQPIYQRPVVITDGRFPNEATFMRATARALVVWVDDSVRNPNRPTPTHASEPTLEVMRPHVHYVLDNNGPFAATESDLRSPWFQSMIHDRVLDGKRIPFERFDSED